MHDFSSKLYNYIVKINFTIIGTGKFGTAIAYVINSHKKDNWEIRTYDLTNDHPPQFCFFTTNLEEACFAHKFESEETADKHFIITAIPAAQVEKTIEKIHKFGLKNVHIILVSKGVSESGEFISQALQQKYSYEISSLAGPHFANDLMQNSNTITIIGCDPKNQQILKTIFAPINPMFTDNPLEVQIASVMKNIAAYCCGLAKGLGCSESTIATVFSLCLEDTKKILLDHNCCTQIISNPAIIADWFMCCSSDTSRNYKAGYQKATQFEANICELAESVKSAKAFFNYLKNKPPFVQLIYNAIFTANNIEELNILLEKSVKQSTSYLIQ